MKRYLLLLLLLLTLPLVAMAQRGATDHLRGYQWKDEYKNSLSVDFAFGALLPYDLIMYDYACYYDRGDRYKDSRLIYPTINIAYNYRFNKTLGIEVVGSYSREESNYFDTFTEQFLIKSSETHLSFLANLKLYWLNRKWVTMYSSFGLGASFYTEKNRGGLEGRGGTESTVVAHLALIGAKVGGRFYGFGELGPSAIGSLRIGLGYKF